MESQKKTSTLLCLVPGKIELKQPLAIGTLQWGTTWIDDKLINHKGVISDDTCRDIVSFVSQHGITLYDTAEGYGGGTSEKRLGRILVSSSSSKSSDSTATTTTSVSSHDDGTEETDSSSKRNGSNTSDHAIFMTKFLPAPWRLFHSDLERAVRGSCHRLQVDCIPMYLLHSPVHWLRPVEYWVESCAKCHRKGLIHAMGLSNCNADQVRRAVEAGKKFGIPVVCNQVHYSLLDYNSSSLQEMERTCKELGVTIIGFSPIGQGLLCDGELDKRKWNTNRSAKMMRLNYEDVIQLRYVVKQLAIKYQKSMAQIAINWVIQHNVIPLVGCRSVTQAQDSVGCLGWELSKTDVETLDKVALPSSTLDSPSWRRMFFVSLFGMVMVVCRTLDTLGFGGNVGATSTKKQQ